MVLKTRTGSKTTSALSYPLNECNSLPCMAAPGLDPKRPPCQTASTRILPVPPLRAGHRGRLSHSLLSWVAQPRSSWALPVDIQRISSTANAIQVGVAQVKQLCQRRHQQLSQSLDIIVADGTYGNHRFLYTGDGPLCLPEKFPEGTIRYRRPSVVVARGTG